MTWAHNLDFFQNAEARTGRDSVLKRFSKARAGGSTYVSMGLIVYNQFGSCGPLLFNMGKTNF